MFTFSSDVLASGWRGKGGRIRTVKLSHAAARSLDRYLRVRARHGQACRPQLWLGSATGGR
jgi:site-specific recombinase XerD